MDGSREAFDLIVCATGYHVAYPFLPTELQRVEGAVVQCYGGSSFNDYKGLYFIGWGEARGGVGSLITAYGSLFTRCLQLQNELNVPIGLVFKEIGQHLPKTHLADPQAIFRQLKFANLLFNWLVKKAHQIDALHPNFSNRPLPSLQSIQQVQS
ncbi:MAG: hypothetical protein PUP92_15595 [Rhizonema sp. PD38]|nr:hypothetical protein [Rhizonema sp. PD38]